MRYYTLVGKAVRDYTGAVCVAECEAGHAVLSYPEPGEWYPASWDFTSAKQPVFLVPYTITHLHVRAAYRGQGIGQKLVGRLQAYARRTGYPISIRVLPYGKGSVLPQAQLEKFYIDCGFRHSGTHNKNVYMVWSP